MPITEDGLLYRLRRNDETLFRVPLIQWPISVNKIHAIMYGVVFGIFVGMLYTIIPEKAILMSVSITLLAFGLTDSIVAKYGTKLKPEGMTLFIITVQHKPHYFIIPYAVCKYVFVI